MTECDSLTDWFHALANHSFDSLVNLASPENIGLLRRHVSRSLPQHPLPEALEPAEFADTIISLRQNESAWNRATMAVLIQADDLHKAGRAFEATAVLRAFADSCPWSLFQEVARNQATHYD